MRFDDRLLTVLNQPAGDRHDSAVRWRQLVDLVARAGPNSANAVVADALAAIRSDAAKVEDGLRAAAARAVAALPCRSACSNISHPTSWPCRRRCSPPRRSSPPNGSASVRCRRGDAALRRDPAPGNSAAPPADRTDELIERARGLGARSGSDDGRSARTVAERSGGADRAPPSQPRRAPPPRAARRERPAVGSPALFRWECGPGGEIAWVEGAPRGPLIGRSIARAQDDDGERVDEEVARAFAMRAPFRDA